MTFNQNPISRGLKCCVPDSIKGKEDDILWEEIMKKTFLLVMKMVAGTS
jgi:hypothetical protein